MLTIDPGAGSGIDSRKTREAVQKWFTTTTSTSLNEALDSGCIVFANYSEDHGIVVVSRTEAGEYICMDPLKEDYRIIKPPMTELLGTVYWVPVNGVKK